MVNWPGREGMDEFDTRINAICRIGRGLAHEPSMTVIGRGGEILFNGDKLDRMVPMMLTEQWRHYMPVEAKMLTELTEEVSAALSLYTNSVVAFRGAVKNDIASAKAAATAIEDNLRRMSAVYHSTAAMLTTPEFMTAIANAERMAAALRAISELQSHSITFAVLDKKPQAQHRDTT